MKYFLGALIFSASIFCHAGSIGFGKAVAIKQYDMGTQKHIKIYLEPGATHANENCFENGRIYGLISHAKHDEAIINRMFSLATAAYISGVKVRLYSDTDSCEIDFVAVQESVF